MSGMYNTGALKGLNYFLNYNKDFNRNNQEGGKWSTANPTNT